MENINDTLLINIDLSSESETSMIEVVTHIGTVRTVLNTFRGDDAHLIYKTLVNKHQQEALLGIIRVGPPKAAAPKIIEYEPIEIVIDYINPEEETQLDDRDSESNTPQ